MRNKMKHTQLYGNDGRPIYVGDPVEIDPVSNESDSLPAEAKEFVRTCGGHFVFVGIVPSPYDPTAKVAGFAAANQEKAGDNVLVLDIPKSGRLAMVKYDYEEDYNRFYDHFSDYIAGTSIMQLMSDARAAYYLEQYKSKRQHQRIFMELG